MAGVSIQTQVFACVLFMFVLPNAICTAKKDTVAKFYLVDYCNKTLEMASLLDMASLEEVIIQINTNGYYYDDNMNCNMTITVRDGFRIIFNILYLQLDTCADSLAVYGSKIMGEVLRPPMCVMPSGILVTATETGTLRFTSNGSGNKGGIKVLVTAFKLSAGGECQDGYHECANVLRCIHEDLFCNGRDNCGDGSDENCEDNLRYIVIGISVGGLVLMGVVVAAVWCYVAKRSNLKMNKPSGVVLAGPHGRRPHSRTNAGFDTEFNTITQPYEQPTTEHEKSEGFTFSSPSTDAYDPAV